MIPAMEQQAFAFSYGVFRPLLSVLGLGPTFSRIEVGTERLAVRMGWAFATDVPRSAIREVAPTRGPVGGIGVHGWRGRWLVNGSTEGLVKIDLDTGQRARVMGLPVALTALTLSVDNPDEFVAALRRGT